MSVLNKLLCKGRKQSWLHFKHCAI